VRAEGSPHRTAGRVRRAPCIAQVERGRRPPVCTLKRSQAFEDLLRTPGVAERRTAGGLQRGRPASETRADRARRRMLGVRALPIVVMRRPAVDGGPRPQRPDDLPAVPRTPVRAQPGRGQQSSPGTWCRSAAPRSSVRLAAQAAWSCAVSSLISLSM
jgi:hypothetical protein